MGVTDLTLFRVYEPHECEGDPQDHGRGYPAVWHTGLTPYFTDSEVPEAWALDGGPYGVKDAVRYEAGHRCERCGHPFEVGSEVGEWSGEATAPAEANGGFQDGENMGWASISFWDDVEGQVLASEVVDGGDAIRKPRTHWSPCDERCTHDGPVRWRPAVEGVPWLGGLPSEQGIVVRPPGEAVRRGHEVQAAWRILTVHHLNGQKNDLRWWNLAALCQRCHLSVQRKVQMERVWPWEHSEWFSPHAAGWYAYSYLGETITRAEAVERQDELLALERAA